MANTSPTKTNIRSTGGQNKPAAGGKAGAGMARGGAQLPSTAKTTAGGRGPVPKAK